MPVLLGAVAANRRRGVSELARPATAPPVTEPSSFDAPMTISSGGTYSGLTVRATGTADAVTVTTAAPVVIEDSWVEHEIGIGIRCQAQDADITIRNNVVKANYPTVLDTWKGRHIQCVNSLNVTIENNWIEHGGGIWILTPTGGASGSIQVHYNQCRNIDGRYSDGAGGYQTGNTLPINTNSRRQQFIQVGQNVSPLHNTLISYNEVVCLPHVSLVADVFNFGSVLGDTVDRVRIYRNCVWGAFPTLTSDGDYRGGGILTVDVPAGQDNIGYGYTDIEECRVMGSTNYGISIAGGQFNRQINNRVVMSNRSEDGTVWEGDGNGCVIWNGGQHEPEGFIGNDIINGWARRWVPTTSTRKDFWMGGCSPPLTDQCCDGTCSYASGSPAGEVTWQDELDEWWDWYNVTRANAGVSLGPSGW